MTSPLPVTPEFQRLVSGSRLRLRGKSAFFATLLLSQGIPMLLAGAQAAAQLWQDLADLGRAGLA